MHTARLERLSVVRRTVFERAGRGAILRAICPPSPVRFLPLAAGLSLLPTLTASAQAVYSSTDGPLTVADGGGVTPCGVSGATVSSVLTIDALGTVYDIDVLVDLSAAWIGDVRAVLSSGTTSVVLIDRPGTTAEAGCGAGQPFAAELALDDEGDDGRVESPAVDGPAYAPGGRYTPAQPLSAFDGMPLGGEWRLDVTDTGSGDATILLGWAIVASAADTTSEEEPSSRYAFAIRGANPARTQTQFDLAVSQTQSVRVVVLDMQGREVRTAFHRTLAGGQAAFVNLPVADLPAGTYIARATGDTFAASVPLTVIH